MPAYLSPEWVHAFNDALSGLDLTEAITAAGAGSFTVAQGSFRVAQVVTDAPIGVRPSPEADVRTVLSVDDGRITFETDPAGTIDADVTVVLTYGDAAAIARGALSPADALAAGRVRVRGELSVLVAGQTILNAASAALGGTLAELTDAPDAPDAADAAGATDAPDGADAADGADVTNDGADAGGADDPLAPGE
jgi:large repetitive protein